MRVVRLIAALSLVSVTLSGCYALDYALDAALYGGPGYSSGHYHGPNCRHRDHRDRDDRRRDRRDDDRPRKRHR